MVNDISSNVEGNLKFPSENIYFPDFSSSFTPIILVSVSKTEEGTNEKGFSYIQGAGDDEESWAQVSRSENPILKSKGTHSSSFLEK